MAISTEEIKTLRAWAIRNFNDYEMYRCDSLDVQDINAANDHERERDYFELVNKLCRLALKENHSHSFKEHDIVKTNGEYCSNGYKIKKGAEGTIVHIYEHSDYFEVEILDEEGKTITAVFSSDNVAAV